MRNTRLIKDLEEGPLGRSLLGVVTATDALVANEDLRPGSNSGHFVDLLNFLPRHLCLLQQEVVLTGLELNSQRLQQVLDLLAVRAIGGRVHRHLVGKQLEP